ncbi:prepilin-type N-terminal cleavage/methylation domain-containing protein [Vibrio sp. B513a]|uniref:Prepilin-type N-terminal cleavage/methylation domain-containing protein n=1 Tax=Vibrio alginolyticus TaxID=663 RepID=A0A7Y4F0X4_VIBAL|nr:MULTISPECIES: prepilin-type N-terminal cleavage/methylation domain-containing protein [Vibrio]EJL6783148.1 prepilin-type N-terminal cleavage/methylation domain-containing protein [Vibrio alginolyticus]ELB2282615.1 prepilin-type N-terminal cleavage/methylation domain-containing protein [Vibrio alginolyticus]KOF32850.1 MSHA biogenesis protein MshC [Vibrio alginolyticus]MCR9999241.1 prepilin-type N-terminal cleavage/methylation domain-containing protein [Vibrio alginolyticus]MDK9753656.1 prepi
MKIRSSALGFTLMELILVIVLLSILSLFAASRFMGSGSFSAYALQERVISVIRQVQVNRMQSNATSPDNNFRLQVSSSCVGSVAACALTGSARDARSDVVIDKSARFSVISGAANTINFNLLGNPVSGAVNILIEDKHGRSSCQVEINSQGYVSKGTCS